MIDTLQVAKNDLKQGWKTSDGAVCKCCGQKVKLYERKLMWMMARGLIRLYWMDRDMPIAYHRNKIMPDDTSGSFAKLEYWGLIKSQVNDDTKKRCSGMWGITSLGRNFVEGNIRVPKYVYTYNQKLYGLPSDELIGIEEALDGRFDYGELMGRLL